MLKIRGLSLLFLLTVTSVPALAQESAAEEPTLTLNQALAIAQESNRQIKCSNKASLQPTTRFWRRAPRYPQFNVQLTGGALLTPVSVSYSRGVFGNVGDSPVPSQNTTITTEPKATGMAIAQAYQPLSQLYNIHLNIEALQVERNWRRSKPASSASRLPTP